MSIVNVRVIAERSLKHQVDRYGRGYVVKSGESGKTYWVDWAVQGDVVVTATCTCGWGVHRSRSDSRSACAHVMAVAREALGEMGYRVSFRPEGVFRAGTIPARPGLEPELRTIEMGDGVVADLYLPHQYLPYYAT